VRSLLAGAVLLLADACSTSANQPPADHTCADACDHMLWTVDQNERKRPVQSVHDMPVTVQGSEMQGMCVNVCASGGVNTACMYTARTTDDAIRCLESARSGAR
jgi:hypothetical protein